MIMRADECMMCMKEMITLTFLLTFSSSHNQVSEQAMKQYRWAYFFAWRARSDSMHDKMVAGGW